MGIQLPLSREKNIVLVGMPGAGKSTIGVLLAKYVAKEFVDTDVSIQVREGKSLQDILDESDYLNLRRIEQEVLLSLQCTNHVIATGGSAAYSDPAMRHLKKGSAVVFLDVDYEVVMRRVHNFGSRGIACERGMTMKDVFAERRPLYLKYADFTIRCDKGNQDDVADMIIQALQLERDHSMKRDVDKAGALHGRGGTQ